MADSYDIWLSCAISSVRHIEILLAKYGNAEGIFRATEKELHTFSELTDMEVSFLTSNKKDENRKRQYDYIMRKDVQVYRFDEKEYPNRFLMLEDKPYCVFVQGRLPKKQVPSIAIVGSRRASSYGLSVASLFAEKLAERGVYIVSGLAMGIDGAGHSAALPYEGRTIGVLGSGIGVPYPKENWQLYQSMREKACILSEYGPEVPPMKYHFPHRNRLISALSDGILVVEAAEKSGTLITVDRGLEQGKEVYAIPGRIDDRNSRGCINLIKQGARLVTNPDEIWEDLVSFYPNLVTYRENFEQMSFDLCEYGEEKAKLSNNSENTHLGIESDGKVLYSLFRLDAKHFDELVEESGFSVPRLMEALFYLEGRGLVQQLVPHYYSKTNIGVGNID